MGYVFQGAGVQHVRPAAALRGSGADSPPADGLHACREHLPRATAPQGKIPLIPYRVEISTLGTAYKEIGKDSFALNFFFDLCRFSIRSLN